MRQSECMPPAEGLRGRGLSVVYVTSVAFTRRGKQLSEKVRRAWNDMSSARREIIVWKDAEKLTEPLFRTSDVLLFFCASGIAVRLAAPFLRDKTADPAVLVIGEDGKFVVPLISGHLGGANRYAHFIAEMLDAQPVITTATDGRKMAALDIWSKKYGLVIDDMKLAKRITAYLLAREDVYSSGGRSEQPIDEPVNDDKIEFRPGSEKTGRISADDRYKDGRYKDSRYKKATESEPNFWNPYYICITEKDDWQRVRESVPHSGEILFLEPKKYVIGIGCRKGTESEKMADFIREFLAENGIDQRLVSRVCSIDLKAEEECIKQTARQLRAEFTVFSKDDLLSVIGDFTTSDFVKQTVGVDNVCERSALLGASEDAGNLRGFYSSGCFGNPGETGNFSDLRSPDGADHLDDVNNFNNLSNLERRKARSGLESLHSTDGMDSTDSMGVGCGDVFFEDDGDFDRIKTDGRDKIDILCDSARSLPVGTSAELIVKKTAGQGMTAAAAAVYFTCRKPVLFTAEEWLQMVQQEN